MAIKLKYNICVVNNCKQLAFTESTGIYSISNTTGWGTPNELISDATSAILTITNTENISYNIDLFTLGLFPSSSNSVTYTIPLALYGNPSSITDGQWYFKYTVITSTTTYVTEKYYYFTCNSENCVNNMIPTEICDSCKDNTDYDNYIKAWSFLKSLEKAAQCGNVTLFNSIKKIIDKLCKNSNCKTCK